MPVTISQERPDTPDSLALIDELETHLRSLYPPDNQFGFSPEKLIKENVVFFVVRSEGKAAACGGVKLFGDFGEIKRMYVRPEFRGQGLAKLMLRQLEDYTIGHGIRMLRLETGIYQPDALGLYERMGYYKRPRFDPYPDAPLSVFYEKHIG